MHDFEKLGAFYLGKRYDTEADKLTDELVLYDSKDLTTHAVIIGMTGSGKTGLGIGILEEAALDHIPVIAIDPKGDMGNLLLTFPKLAADDFRPWVNPRTAMDKGQTVDQFAAGQAALWKKGLGEWGQTGERIAQLRKNVDLNIYTPGSNSGLPVSVLQSFSAPDQSLIDDIDLYRERVQSTATGILTLLDIDADPVASREHILISRLLDNAWREGRSLDVPTLIGEIQNPPITKVGVMNLDAFFPARDRFALAMRLNNLLAAPGFEAWMQGTPLNAKNLLYTEEGKPRISIMSIAHLDDAQRMFFVSMLLNELIAWMRAQQGTSSLRAILYMDEIFGYMPPIANPPSKNLFLTLLKQARAYGLGLVLATQNPVDLDYKGLSNTGTWFIGRLQTERDKARVMEGLEGASGGSFNKQDMERTIAGLGKRRFLLHNVHEDEAVVFNTRWVMSYLAGPLTRDHIRSLMSGAKDKLEAVVNEVSKPKRKASDSAPALPPAVEQFFVEGAGAGDRLSPSPDRRRRRGVHQRPLRHRRRAPGTAHRGIRRRPGGDRLGQQRAARDLRSRIFSTKARRARASPTARRRRTIRRPMPAGQRITSAGCGRTNTSLFTRANDSSSPPRRARARAISGRDYKMLPVKFATSRSRRFASVTPAR